MAGKTINELDARTMPNGKENIPFQEGNTKRKIIYRCVEKIRGT